MGIYGALFSGVSGLNAQSQALGVISDNISNVNTTGYKTARSTFSTLVTTQTMNMYSPGGVRFTPLYDVTRQGLIQASANATDLALTGQGFFTVTQSSSPASTDQRFYTRAGSFQPDSSGFLRTPTGFYLQGLATDANGVPTAANPSDPSNLEAVRVNTVSGSARSTANIGLGVNLPASGSASEATVVPVYDSLGVRHDLTFTWTKTGTNAWTVTAAVPAGDLDGMAGSGVFEGAAGSVVPFSVDIVFNGDGTPATYDGAATPPDLQIAGWLDGANDNSVTLDFGTAGLANGVTQFASAYSTTFIDQDGATFGNFAGVTVDEDGIVTANFDNGQSLKIFKIPVTTFANPGGLNAKTGTLYIESAESGTPVVQSAGTAAAGKIVPTSLEASTTDLATEFTNMIITQQAYSAAAKVITTGDQMLTTLIQIIR
jgi:flagellar hook protein FlgE